MTTQLLLDTHGLLWWLAEPDRLSPAAHAAISDPSHTVHVSAASGWEIAPKVRLGKLPGVGDLPQTLPQHLLSQGFDLLPITLHQGLNAGSYAMAHRDPFDRLLAAQAELARPKLVSVDPALHAFPCRILW